MSPPTALTTELRALVAEIRDDLEAMSRLREKLLDAQARLTAAEPSSIDVMAAAGFLHHAYTAMESVHERIVARVDSTVLQGERRHAGLLTRVSVEVPGVRPAVIRPETRARLARLLRFRHFFRHAYRIDLLADEVRGVMTGIGDLIDDYRRDVEAFCRHLEDAAAAP
jgi:hypothetical protein